MKSSVKLGYSCFIKSFTCSTRAFNGNLYIPSVLFPIAIFPLAKSPIAISDPIAHAPTAYFPIASAPNEYIPIEIAPIEKIPNEITPTANKTPIAIKAKLI